MKHHLLYLFLFSSTIACNRSRSSSPTQGNDTASAVMAPVAIQKSVHKKVFAHLMPWFETKESSRPAGTWGIHWTMANQNPDIIKADGNRQVASYYNPLTGPYASGDTSIIEYQLLLMKLSGIDGVFIDWPGTTNLYDYPKNLQNAEKVIAALGKTGLHYAIVYEDQNINIAFSKGVFTDKVAAAQNDMRYLQQHYFTDSNYERLNQQPLLLVFGPQTFVTEKDWTAVLSVLDQKPSFFTLWSFSGKAGNTAAGEFAWINSDNTTSLQNFYGNGYAGTKISAAYPGFDPFYKQGGWDGPTFKIDANGAANFSATLDLAIQSNTSYIQLPTWNDYGEGTMIEPTAEYKYSLLALLQQKLGVASNQQNLELVSQLYTARKRYVGDAGMQKNLDKVFYYIVSLQTDQAAALLKSIP
jgi:hypothetical protein